MKQQIATIAIMVGFMMMTGCVDVPTPQEESVGQFRVLNVLLQNSCGQSAVPAEPEVFFLGEVFEDASTDQVAWRPAQQAKIVGTKIDDVYRFESDTPIRVYEAGEYGATAACDLVQSEHLELEIVSEQGETERELSGMHSIEFSPAPGADCRPSLTTYGGPFESFPCNIQYELSGSAVDMDTE